METPPDPLDSADAADAVALGAGTTAQASAETLPADSGGPVVTPPILITAI